MEIEEIKQVKRDAELAEILAMVRRCGVTVHVRGTDDAPVVEFRDKRTCKVVGGKEMRKRLAVVTW